MNRRAVATSVACVFLLPLLAASSARAAPVVELYGTFHAMGIVVTLSAADDPNANATVSVAYRTSGTGPYRAGLPLARIGSTRLAGSLFWLTPGTSYDVRLTFTDPDGHPIAGTVVDKPGSTRADIVIGSPGRSLVVSPAGAGSACSLTSPCALRTGIGLAQAGDEVVLRGGTYFDGELTLSRSGTAGAPIVIRGYAGERAILDGSDPGSFTWASQGGGVYRTTLRTADPHVVLAGGARLFPYATRQDLGTQRWGVPGFFASGPSLDVHLAGGANPTATAMVVARYNFAFHVEQRFIYFLDLTFRYYGGGAYAKAIYFLDGSDNLVRRCTFEANDIGVALKYDSHRNVVEDSEFFDSIGSWPWDGVKSGADVEDGGVYVYEPMTGRGTVIRRNRFHDDFDAMHVCPWGGSTTTEVDVYQNLAFNLGDDGMETDGYCSNVRIWANTFHDTLMGVSLAPVYTGPVYVIRNLIYRTGAGGRAGSGFKFNSGYDRSGPMYLLHNTVDAARPGQDALYIAAPGTWTGIYARNNIFAGTQRALTNENPAQPLDLDYDNLYTSAPGPLAWWEGLADRSLDTLAELRAATGQELRGLSAAPGFADVAAANYGLSASSRLVDAGAIIPGVNDVFTGAAPDIGAFELGSGSGLDLDGDSLPDAWETQFGLDPTVATGADGAAGDPDGDGLTNLQEFQQGRHPRGFFTRYFAEGATGTFFDLSFALLNPTSARSRVNLFFNRSDGKTASYPLTLESMRRATVNAETAVKAVEAAEFSTVVESDVLVVADRTMRWDDTAYGGHTETSVAAPATRWYLAEGATHSGFDLFYLLQNPSTTATARVTVTFLLPGGGTLARQYDVTPDTRVTIWVDQIAPLSNTDVSAVIDSSVALVVERAMYLHSGGLMFGAGHESAGVTAPATNWFLAEGATGVYFDLFLLMANPNPDAATVTATYLLPTGATFVKAYAVAGRSRHTIWVDLEEIPPGSGIRPLANAAVSTTIASTRPIIVERAMWWPGPTAATWFEAHNSPGSTAAGPRWALAEGERRGPPRNVATYVLIANTSSAPATVDVTFCFEARAPVKKTYVVGASSRFNVDVTAMVAEAVDQRFGVIVESVGTTPAQLVVERAMYWDARGQTWAAGTNALATRLP